MSEDFRFPGYIVLVPVCLRWQRVNLAWSRGNTVLACMLVAFLNFSCCFKSRFTFRKMDVPLSWASEGERLLFC